MIRLAVFGNPISHSLSPQLHQEFARQCNMKLDYQKICVPLHQFKNTVDDFRAAGGLGANVTAPFKMQAFDYADELTDRAHHAGSVNTFIFKNNHCIGDNTDGIGLIRDLKHHAITLQNKTILILGAGGAARAILQNIIQEKPHKIIIYNRTTQHAEKIIDFFQRDFPITIFSGEKNSDVVINATAIRSQQDFSLDLTLKNTMCYDMNYGEHHSAFYQYAISRGATQIKDGLGMLIEQGAESFFQWTGKKLGG